MGELEPLEDELFELPETDPLAEPCAFCDWSLEGWLEVSVEYWDPAPPVAVLLLFWLEELLLPEVPEIDPFALLAEVLSALELEPGVELEPEIEVLLYVLL